LPGTAFTIWDVDESMNNIETTRGQAINSVPVPGVADQRNGVMTPASIMAAARVRWPETLENHGYPP
jgi:hypothetical protein